MDNKDILERIKSLTEQRNMRMKDLVSDSGISFSKMSKLLKGTQSMSLDDLIKIGEALNMNPAALISPNMDDVESSHKEIKPISTILRLLVKSYGTETKFCYLLDNELANTMSQYIDLKGSGKSVYAQAKKKRQGKSGDKILVSIPRVVITDARKGQLFNNQLSVGYWFPGEANYVYLSINYIRGNAPATIQPPTVAARNMIEYFGALVPVQQGTDCYTRADLSDNASDKKMLDAGTIFYKKYKTNELYTEDDLRKDLQDMYDTYLELLDSATKRVQATYENMYLNGRKVDRSVNKEKTNRSFDRTDLDRIMPVDSSIRERHINRTHAIRNALVREDYKCELNREHDSFIDRTTGMNYMEGHMLIPSSAQTDFKESLDIEANICCLCPTCKAKINKASDVERQEVIMSLYLKHKDKLKEKGIDITPMKLFKYYGMN